MCSPGLSHSGCLGNSSTVSDKSDMGTSVFSRNRAPIYQSPHLEARYSLIRLNGDKILRLEDVARSCQIGARIICKRVVSLAAAVTHGGKETLLRTGSMFECCGVLPNILNRTSHGFAYPASTSNAFCVKDARLA